MNFLFRFYFLSLHFLFFRLSVFLLSFLSAGMKLWLLYWLYWVGEESDWLFILSKL